MYHLVRTVLDYKYLKIDLLDGMGGGVLKFIYLADLVMEVFNSKQYSFSRDKFLFLRRFARSSSVFVLQLLYAQD